MGRRLNIHKIFELVLIGLVFTSSSQAMETVSLNGMWEFKTDPYNTGLHQEWFLPDADESSWDAMVVPGNWDTEAPYAEYTGIAWYRTTFQSPEEHARRLVRLVFESVYNESEIWINGIRAGDNALGFLPFSLDIGRFLQAHGENTLTVRVDNRFKRGAIWNWGGIRRPVWLEVSSPVRIERQYIRAIPDLNEGTAEIDVAVEIYNSTSRARELGYRVQVFHEGTPDDVIHAADGSMGIAAGGLGQARLHFSMAAAQVRFWDFNHPELYVSQVTLFEEERELQTLVDRFGIRKLEVNGNRLLLNGVAYRPLGFNLLPEDRYTGNSLPLSRIREDVALLKSLGANFARLSHLPLPKEYLNLLDENGIMTFEEVALWGKDAWVDPDHPMPKQWLQRMIESRYNHPSVVGWSVGNEIGFPEMNPKVNAYVEGAIAQAKEQDPDRLAVYVTHSADKLPDDASRFSDLIMLNKYADWGRALENTHNHFPDKPIFMSEFGLSLNDERPNFGVANASAMLNEMRFREYTVGASYWTLIDYRSNWHHENESWKTGPSQNRAWGILNNYRQKKRAYFDFRKEYAPVTDPVLVHHAATMGSTAEFTFSARQPLDLPAYELRDYFLLWQVFDSNADVVARTTTELPHIKPDGGEHTFDFAYQTEQTAAALQVDLLDALGHSLLTVRRDLLAPNPPTDISIQNAADKSRVTFEKVWNADEYSLKYEGVDGWTETPATIDAYIEIESLPSEAIGFVVARNGFGESQSNQAVTIETTEQELPPLVLDVRSGVNSFYIGYESSNYDFLYEMEVGEEPGEYERLVSFKNRGSYKLPGLENGKTYYFRLRRRVQHGFASMWTREYSVTVGDGVDDAMP